MSFYTYYDSTDNNNLKVVAKGQCTGTGLTEVILEDDSQFLTLAENITSYEYDTDTEQYVEI